MSYPGQGVAYTRLTHAALANEWRRTGYPLVFGARALTVASGVLRFGQQVSNAIGVSDAEAALVEGPFAITDYAIRNRVAVQTVDVDYTVWVDGADSGLLVSIPTGGVQGSVSGFVAYGSGLHLVRFQFDASGADATVSRPGATVRLVRLP